MCALVTAGYVDTGGPAFIFTGDARYAISKIDGADWITTIQLGDGDRAYRFARVNRSYKPGDERADGAPKRRPEAWDSSSTRRSRSRATCRASLPAASRSPAPRATSSRGYSRPTATCGRSNGKLQVLLDAQVLSDQAVVISVDSGMIGSPEYGQPQQAGQPPTLKVKHRLRNFVPGQQVAIQSRDIDNGVFRVDKVTMTGDTWGTEPMVSELDCHPIGSRIKQKKKR